MSLFKRLFGKNKKEEVQNQQNLSEVIDESSAEININEEKTEEESQIEDEVSPEVEEIKEPLVQDTLDLESEDQIQLEQDMERLEEDVERQETTSPEALVDDEVEEENTEFVEQVEKVEEESPVQEKKGFIKRLFSGLSKTRDSILKGVDNVLSNFKQIDEELYEELEEALIMADFGVDTTLHIMDKLRAKVKEDKISDPNGLKPALQEIITKFLTDQPTEDILNPNGPTVVLVIGVNGVGKTTSIGKMSHLFKSQHKKVLVAAADTFRAAAIEQLSVWTERAGVEIIKHEEGSDAAAVVFDAISAAKSRKSDVLICDTAGRLQNKTNLMKELEKISRIIAREYPEAKKEILIVIDATTGQNAMQQVKLFKEVADISGIILTKLDGTAKGGAIVGIYESLKVPVKYIGVGEKIDDLQPFDAVAFANALFNSEASNDISSK